MAVEQLANHAGTTLNDAGGINNSDTSAIVASATGMPATGNFRIKIDSELILVGSRSGTTLSGLIRGIEGTAAASHSDGAAVDVVVTEQALENYVMQQTSLLLDLGREVMNFPSLEGADGAQPLWWSEIDGNATLTEEDGAGESLTETYATRVLKLVTAASSKYAYQRFTYADQPRVKSGRSASVMVAVWSVSSAPARIRLRSSVGVLGTSVDTTAAAWTILTIEPVTLDGTYVQLELECDTGTAYFIPLTSRPRGLIYKAITTATVKTLTGIADEATWTDVDVTANTSNLAVMANLMVRLNEGASGFDLSMRLNGSGKSNTIYSTIDPGAIFSRVTALVLLDDAQIFEYNLDRFSGSSTLDFGVIELIGFWDWE